MPIYRYRDLYIIAESRHVHSSLKFIQLNAKQLNGLFTFIYYFNNFILFALYFLFISVASQLPSNGHNLVYVQKLKTKTKITTMSRQKLHWTQSTMISIVVWLCKSLSVFFFWRWARMKIGWNISIQKCRYMVCERGRASDRKKNRPIKHRSCQLLLNTYTQTDRHIHNQYNRIVCIQTHHTEKL